LAGIGLRLRDIDELKDLGTAEAGDLHGSRPRKRWSRGARGTWPNTFTCSVADDAGVIATAVLGHSGRRMRMRTLVTGVTL
jgi:hypothetical protein